MDEQTQASLLPELVPDKVIKKRKPRKRTINPMLKLVGEHAIESKTCAGCSYLLPIDTGLGELYRCYAYDLRKGPGSDHNPTWQACELYTTEPLSTYHR